MPMKTIESHGIIYHIRDYINGYEYDIIMNTLFDFAKEGKDLAELGANDMVKLFPALKKVSRSLIEEPKVEDIDKLDARFISEVNTYALGLFMELAQSLTANNKPDDKKKA